MPTPNRGYTEINGFSTPDVPFEANRTFREIDADVEAVDNKAHAAVNTGKVNGARLDKVEASDSTQAGRLALLEAAAGFDAEPLSLEDDVVTALLNDPATSTAAEVLQRVDAAVAALPAPILDKGHAAASKLAIRSGDVAVGVAGDSTGNADGEWPYLTSAAIGERVPTLTVESRLWNDAAQDYAADETIQNGLAEGVQGVAFQDTFTRTVAELAGSTPDIGPAWGTSGSNALGDFSTDGTAAVCSGDTVTSALLANTGAAGDMKLTVNVNMDTTGGAETKLSRLYFNYLSPDDHLYLQISLWAAGGSQLSVFKRINGVVTEIAAAPAGLLPTGTDTTAQIVVEKIGGQVVATVNGQEFAGVLTQPEAELLNGSDTAGLMAQKAGLRVTIFTVELTTLAPGQHMQLWNASMSGSRLDYQLDRLEQMFPEPLDLIFISSCHNYGSDTAGEYIAKLDAFVAALRLQRPEAGIIVCSQNPQIPPAAGGEAHLSRLAALRSYCHTKGIGYVPVVEAFRALADGGESLIADDGIHPTPGATGTGSALWRDVVLDYLEAVGLPV